MKRDKIFDWEVVQSRLPSNSLICIVTTWFFLCFIVAKPFSIVYLISWKFMLFCFHAMWFTINSIQFIAHFYQYDCINLMLFITIIPLLLILYQLTISYLYCQYNNIQWSCKFKQFAHRSMMPADGNGLEENVENFSLDAHKEPGVPWHDTVFSWGY